MLDDIKTLRESLWKNGYRPIAVYTKQKKPVGLKWTERARANPPEAAVSPVYPYCMSTAILCDGLRAVDIDIQDMDLALHIRNIAFELLGKGPIRTRSGTGKNLILYKALEGSPARKQVLGNNEYTGCAVEILGHGRSFIGYGVHPEGMLYEWLNNIDLIRVPIDKLISVSEEKIDLFLSEISSIIKIEDHSHKFQENIQVKKSTTNTNMEKYSQVALNNIIKDLKICMKGGRNNLLNKSAIRLASLSARGWITESICRQALLDACAHNGLLKEDGKYACEATIKSGWKIGTSNPAKNPDSFQEEDFEENDNIIIDLKVSCKKPIEKINLKRNKLDDSLSYPAGILGNLTNWICDSGPTGNRWLALSAALSLISMLLGRCVSTPTEGSLELYIIATYPTGGGKSHQERAINSIIDKLKLEKHMADSEFKSGAYIEDLIQNKPLSLSIQDEFGQILSDMTAKNSPSYINQISTHLRKLYGNNFNIYRIGGVRSRPSTSVYAPHLSLYCMTTSAQLFNSIKSKDISNGIINRFMLIDGGDERTFSSPDKRISVKNPPDGLLRDLYNLYMIGAPKNGNMSGSHDKNTSPKPDIYIVPWKDKESELEYYSIEKECCSLIDSDKDIGEIYARTSFNTIKIATILACCENFISPSVSKENIRWAFELSKQSSDIFFNEIKNNMSDNIGYYEIFKKIELILSSYNEKGLPPFTIQRRKLWDKMKNYCGKTSSDFSNCLKELEKNEVAIVHKIGKMTVVSLIPHK